LVLLVEETRVPGGRFYWLPKPEYLEKTSDLPQVTDKLYQWFAYFAFDTRPNTLRWIF